jgi:hypothetical protein
MELNIGSDIIRNSSGILSVEGQDQIYLEIGERDDQLLLTMDVYDAEGNHIAKLRRNAWAFNNRDRFDITTIPSSLRLTDTDSGDLVVEANVTGPSRIEVLNGRFYTNRGHLLEITPDYWRIGGVQMSGTISEGTDQMVVIGQDVQPSTTTYSDVPIRLGRNSRLRGWL